MKESKEKIENALKFACLSFKHARELVNRYQQLETINHNQGVCKERLQALERSFGLIRNINAKNCIASAMKEQQRDLKEMEYYFTLVKERIQDILNEYP